jgi:hypothetical protein
MFENRVLRKIFGPRRRGSDKMLEKLHNEELLNFYSWPKV